MLTTLKQFSAIECLVASLELSLKSWKVASSVGLGHRARVKSIRACDWDALAKELAVAKARWKLPADAPVVVCYEAGRDGFWIQRRLEQGGIHCVVLDPGSLARGRSRKAAKTDRLDAEELVNLLIRKIGGDDRACRLVRVPTQAEEDARVLHRELITKKQDRVRHINRIKAYLVTEGVRIVVSRAAVPPDLDQIRRWDGSALPEEVLGRLRREYQCYAFLTEQIRELEAIRRQQLRESTTKTMSSARRLLRLRALGECSSTTFAAEVFGWREFRNGREVGAFFGLAPGVSQSGEMRRDGSITKAGSRRLRSLAVEIAWCWLRLQPDSDLSQWYRRRFKSHGSRLRRIGIVAMARKLMVQLWRFLETGEVPPGALLKVA
jgi:transposase